jgi:hypothetical protein
MKEVVLRDFMRGCGKYLIPGEYLLLKRGKPHLKVVITPAEKETTTTNMVVDANTCRMPGCEYECDGTGLCLKHQRGSA